MSDVTASIAGTPPRVLEKCSALVSSATRIRASQDNPPLRFQTATWAIRPGGHKAMPDTKPQENRMEESAWYRRLSRTWRTAFADHGRRYRARIEPVSDESTKNLVDEAYKAKYRGQGSALREVISPRVRDYTMKVILPGRGMDASQ